MNNSCDTCLNKVFCKKTTGFMFGFCNSDYKPDTDLIDFINCLFSYDFTTNCCSEEIELSEAALTLRQLKEDGVEVPDSMTAELYQRIYNSYC